MQKPAEYHLLERHKLTLYKQSNAPKLSSQIKNIQTCSKKPLECVQNIKSIAPKGQIKGRVKNISSQYAKNRSVELKSIREPAIKSSVLVSQISLKRLFALSDFYGYLIQILKSHLAHAGY